MRAEGSILDGVYQIVREIGHGGTGVIYLAMHLRLNKYVVIKKIKEGYVDPAKLRTEVDILKRLHHTCLPQVYDFLVIGQSVFTVMDYIPGYDLQYYLDAGYSFPETLIRKWLAQMLDVLNYLHGQNPPIFHSDIKPGNLMVTGDWDLCLIDFNISIDGENTKDVQGMSLYYAAPEQYERAQAILYGTGNAQAMDGRMDIYSLGATMYRVMTGQNPSPLQGQTTDIADMELDYSAGLCAVVSKMMRYDRRQRFATAEQAARSLARIERMDPAYRRFSFAQIITLFGYLGCALAACLMIWTGFQKNISEQWNADDLEFSGYVQVRDEENIQAQGVSMLNDSTYQRFYEKHPEEYAGLLYYMGESDYRMEDYAGAAEYYRQAWEEMPDEAEYCESYLIALVQAGNDSLAEQTAQSAACKSLLSEADEKLIRAWTLWLSGETDEAEALAEEILSSSGTLSDYVVEQTGMLLAEIYESTESYGKAAEALSDITAESDSADLWERLGNDAFYAYSNSEKQNGSETYLAIARNAYEHLYEADEASYENAMNLAIIYRASGSYQRSNDVLRLLAEQNTDRYEPDMWMCYNYLDLALEAGSINSVKSDLSFRYQEAQRLYQTTGETDEDMTELKELMKEWGL